MTNQWKYNQITDILIPENVIQNVVYKSSIIFPMSQR